MKKNTLLDCYAKWRPRVLIALSLLSVAICAATATVGAEKPDARGAAVQIFKEWLVAINGNDASKRRFIDERVTDELRRGRSVEDLVQRDRALFERAGGFELVKIERSTETEAAVLLRERAGDRGYARLHLALVPGDPQHIQELRIAPAEAAATETSTRPRISEAQLIAELTKHLDELAAADKFSGVVLLAKEAQPIFAKAYGFANIDKKERNTLDTQFNVGSMNKMMTAVAITQLEQRGKLKFTDSVASLLSDYPDRANASKITVHHLLTHTSGLGDYFGPDYRKQQSSLHNLSDYVPLFAGKPLKFEPGQGWAYSNAGYLLLGRIVEKVSGQDFYSYVLEHVFKPAGMSQSAWYGPSDRTPRRATGYMKGSSTTVPRVPNVEVVATRGTSAGGGYSTAGDLLKFSVALRAHKLLDADRTKLLWTGKVQLPQHPEEEYGYGFGVRTVDGHHIAWHNGGAPGVNADFAMYLEFGYTAIVLSNYDPPSAGDVAMFLRQRLSLSTH